jgi:hypothetical protein
MAEKVPQSYANHVRFDPSFHFFLAPGSLLVPILSIINVVRHFRRFDAWILLLIGILFPVAVTMTRVYSLKVQDRLIRLEERLRLQSLLSGELSSRIGELTESQLVALRFASDQELPSLVPKILTSNMASKDIKMAIVTWRPDTFRV